MIADENTIMWSLQSAVGKSLTLLGDQGQPIRCRIVGMLKRTVLQGAVIMDEATFVRLFPHEISATSRDGVDRWSGDSLTFDVVPTEPGPHGGHVQDVVILTILCIILNKERVINVKLI